jgi:hypothetical protein
MLNEQVDISSLTHISHEGLYNGKMAKIGEFVKNWKVSYSVPQFIADFLGSAF